MFFCHEILQRRHGPFGVIWLAAMQNKSLTRREYERVRISDKCEEILAYIMSRVKTTKDHTRRFSLYLSAQLMFGTVKVYYQQNMHLLADCLEYEKRVKKSLVRELMAMPESLPLSERRLNLPENFSNLSIYDITDDVSNPHIRCHVDLLVESIDFLRDDGDEIPGSNSAALPPHTAPHQSITLPEYSTELSTNNHIYPLFSEVPDGQDLAPMSREELEGFYIEGPPVSPIKHMPELDARDMQTELTLFDPISEQNLLAQQPDAIQEMLEQTPAIPVPDIEPARPEKQSTEEEEQQPPSKRARVSGALVLPPLEEDRRERVKRRVLRAGHLIIDENRRISKEFVKECLHNHQATTKLPELSIHCEKLETLMTEPGSEGNFTSRLMKNFFKQLCTPHVVTAVIPVPVPGRETAAAEGTSLPADTSREHLRADLTTHSRPSDGPTLNVSATIINRSGQETPADGIYKTPSSNRPSRDRGKKRARTDEERLPMDETYIARQNDPTPIPPLMVEDEIPPPPQDEPFNPPPQDELPPPGVEEMPPPPDMMEEQLARTPNNISQPGDPSLYIEDVADVRPVDVVPPTPRTLSVRDRLTRSLKKHLLAENSVVFTELTDLIRPGVTSRQEVAQLFHALLTVAKRKNVNISQDDSFGPITIQKGPRFTRTD